jgi:hypothetical protein
MLKVIIEGQSGKSELKIVKILEPRIPFLPFVFLNGGKGQGWEGSQYLSL